MPKRMSWMVIRENVNSGLISRRLFKSEKAARSYAKRLVRKRHIRVSVQYNEQAIPWGY